METNQNAVPPALRSWFIAHFIIDMLFAIPLFFAPNFFMSLFGWQTIDPYTTRIAAAALFGIGIESWLGRNASIDAFRETLNLKVIWSSMAIIGIAWSLIEGAQGRPWGAWFTLIVFIIFNGVWLGWRKKLR